jgi:hypothetical protein
VDLALQGAAHSGRGKWTDDELYYILGNKLLDSASHWWVVMNRKWKRRERTWTNLKEGLLRRYGERLDISAAEWRVNQRIMMPGETYADFAAGLRDATGRNRVEERVLLAQFYRCLSLTVRQLVRQREPQALEEAVDHATEIDDTNANVAHGMQNIGQPWATGPSQGLISMAGTTGQTLVIPGIGGTSLPLGMEDMTGHAMQGAMTGAEASTLALFTNPQGIWNKYSGTWEVPPGRSWNGKFWTEMGRRDSKPKQLGNDRRGSSRPVRPADKKAKVMLTAVPELSSDEESDASEAPPPKKARRKGPVKQAAAPGRTADRPDAPRRDDGPGGRRGVFTTSLRCYACGEVGHFADRCTDPEAKARNDAFLDSRRDAPKTEENEDRA